MSVVLCASVQAHSRHTAWLMRSDAHFTDPGKVRKRVLRLTSEPRTTELPRRTEVVKSAIASSVQEIEHPAELDDQGTVGWEVDADFTARVVIDNKQTGIGRLEPGKANI